MNTAQKGNLSELKIAVRLTELGKNVLRPFGEGSRYDLLLDEDGIFKRIQCKTGRLRNGSIVFNTASGFSWKTGRRDYKGQAELFGVYCPDTGHCYLVPVDSVPGSSIAYLRVDPTVNNQSKRIRFAKDFEL